MGDRMRSAKGIVMLLILLLVIEIPSIQSQTNQGEDGFIPIRFWRTNPADITINQSSVFPMVLTTGNASLSNLGKAYIAWSFETDQGLFAAARIYLSFWFYEIPTFLRCCQPVSKG